MEHAESVAELPLDQHDAAVARQSFAAMPESIKLIDDLLILLNHGTATLSGEKHDRDLNFLTGLLILRAFNSLWRGRQNAVAGYAVQCLILARAALEDWVAVRWIEENPDEKSLWLCRILEGIPAPLGSRGRERRIPSTGDMLKNLPDGAVAQMAYQLLSKLAHPHGVGLGWQFHADAESAYVHCGPNFDHRDLETCLFFLAHVAGGLLPCVERLQVRWRGAADIEWVDRGKAAVERCRAFIDEVGRQFREGDLEQRESAFAPEQVNPF